MRLNGSYFTHHEHQLSVIVDLSVVTQRVLDFLGGIEMVFKDPQHSLCLVPLQREARYETGTA